MITSSISFYPVIDIEQTEIFYKQVIGLKLVYSYGKSRVFSAVKGHLGFVQYDDNKPATGRLCLSINCINQQAVIEQYERIIALGYVPMGEPKLHQNFPVFSFFIEDPNGYLVEFQKIENINL